MVKKSELDKLRDDRRSYNRFEIKQQSIEVEVIVEGYKKLPGVSILNNVSLGGINIQVKEPVEAKSKVKFRLGKSKTIFDGLVAWCKESGVETYPYRLGVSFIFPYEREAVAQQRELLQFVLKTLNRMPKQQLVDRLIGLFIERRKIFDIAQHRIEEVEQTIKEIRSQSEDVQNKVHSILDLSLSAVLYLDEDYNIVYSNQTAEEMLGYNSEEFKEFKITNIVQESTGKMIKRYYEASNSGIYNGVAFNKNGDDVPVKWRVLQHTNEDRDVLCYMFLPK